MVKYIIISLLIGILSLRFVTIDKVELQDGQSLSFSARLTQEPSVKNGRKAFTLFYKGNRIYIIVPGESEYRYGDIISVNGRVGIRLINGKNEFISMYFPKTEAKKDNLAVFFGLRQHIISVFEKTLPSNYSSLLLGIVFGIKSSMSSDFLNNLKILGLMHIIAASGMNVTLVAGFLSAIFLLFLKRQIALILTIAGIFIYAFLAGFEPSIVRASIMGMITFTAQILGRQKLAGYSLFATAYIMILFSPFVIWDIGFQLSFVSTAGLIFLRPVLYQIQILKKFFKFIVVGEDVSTTISAQIATLPILLANFGLYSVVSVAVNAFVLWTIPFIMIIGGVGFLIVIVIEPLGKSVMYLSIPFLFYFEAVVNVFSIIPGSIESISPPFVFILGYYLILLSIISFAMLKKDE